MLTRKTEKALISVALRATSNLTPTSWDQETFSLGLPGGNGLPVNLTQLFSIKLDSETP